MAAAFAAAMAVYRRGKVWWHDFYQNGRRIRERSNAISKRLAEIEMGDKKRRIEEKRLDIKKNKNILFEDMSDEYYESYSKPNKRAYWRDHISLKNLKKFFSGKYLHHITPQMIENYKTKRKGDGVEESTINRELTCMKTLYNKAILWEKTTNNPVTKIKLFKEDNSRVHWLEKKEEELLISSCSNTLRPIVLVALNSGMRQGNILNLKWIDLDLARGFLTIRAPKNKETKHLPMNTILVETLEQLKASRKIDSQYVFCDNKGRKLSKNCYLFRREYKDAVRLCGVQLRHPDFNFHSLRHSFCSKLAMKGVDIHTISKLAGHKTLAMTMRYAHLSPNFMRSAVELATTGNQSQIQSQTGNAGGRDGEQEVTKTSENRTFSHKSER